MALAALACSELPQLELDSGFGTACSMVAFGILLQGTSGTPTFERGVNITAAAGARKRGFFAATSSCSSGSSMTSSLTCNNGAAGAAEALAEANSSAGDIVGFAAACHAQGAVVDGRPAGNRTAPCDADASSGDGDAGCAAAAITTDLHFADGASCAATGVEDTDTALGDAAGGGGHAIGNGTGHSLPYFRESMREQLAVGSRCRSTC
jgi:hypothetical protein